MLSSRPLATGTNTTGATLSFRHSAVLGDKR